ncbi:hypothetical protein HNQ59_003933, partial [Chitinivorax tropicus]|nr:hypothetical protein [Chitinivorax tropicus]
SPAPYETVPVTVKQPVAGLGLTAAERDAILAAGKGPRVGGSEVVPNTVAIGADSTTAAFDGALYPQDKLRQLVSYLDKRGVRVYGTNSNPRFDAKWDGTGTMYLPENPTALQVKHELSHYLDLRNQIKAADDVRSGVQAYVDMGRVGREEAVLNRLQGNRIWQQLNDAEKNFSIDYVNRLKKEAGQ